MNRGHAAYGLIVAVLLGGGILMPIRGHAENSPSAMHEDTDGVLAADEYRVISANGGVTRRPCPYTCEMRGIPRTHCKEWRSRDEAECYVSDTTLPENVMPNGDAEQTRADRGGYKH